MERVLGMLALSRSFGDFNYKNIGITCELFYSENTVNNSDKHIVVKASDGVWDVIQDEELLKACKKLED